MIRAPLTVSRRVYQRTVIPCIVVIFVLLIWQLIYGP